MDNDNTITVMIPGSHRVTITKSLWPIVLRSSNDDFYIEIRERAERGLRIIIAGKDKDPIAGSVVTMPHEYIGKNIHDLINTIGIENRLSYDGIVTLRLTAFNLIDNLPAVNID